MGRRLNFRDAIGRRMDSLAKSVSGVCPTMGVIGFDFGR